MEHSHAAQPDFGTGQKRLSVYFAGFVACVALTLLSFWSVMSGHFDRTITYVILYSSAIVQFFIQVICFLRLNTQTEQGRANVLSFVFSGVILVTIVIGSVWIMWNTNYFMMH